jgi:plastocyanin
MRDFIHRVFMPLTLPLVSILVIAVIVLNFSRVLLAVNKHTAAVIALCVAALVLFGCTYFSAAGRPGSALNLAAPIVFIAVLSLSGVIALASQHPKGHGKVLPPVPTAVTVTAKNTSFVNKALSVAAPASGRLGIAYQNDDPNEHTLVFDEVPGFKLDAKKGNGEIVKGAAALEAGKTYTFFCDIPGHRQAGMEGKLTVTGGGAPAGPVAAGGGSTTPITVHALDALKFEPATATAPAGTIAITYINDASSPHTMAIDGVASFKELKVTKKGDTVKATVPLTKGKYTLYCTLPGHRSAGMETALTVT